MTFDFQTFLATVALIKLILMLIEAVAKRK